MNIKFYFLILLVSVFVCTQNSYGTTITVINNSDAGAGSLRAAIDLATSGDTITFTVTGTITLDSTITWGKTLTIMGPGAASLTIDGNNSTNMFQMNSGRNLFSGITFNHGNGPTGGCILANSSTTTDSTIILYCVFKNSNSSDEASAVEADGSILVMQYCTVDSCTNSNIAAVALFGGAILNSTFSNCTAGNSGGAVWVFDDSTTITNCTFYNNSAGGGGAILDEIRTGHLTLINNTFDKNYANYFGSCLMANPSPGPGSSMTIVFENNIFYGDSNFYINDIHSFTGTSGGGNICSDNTMSAFLTGTNDMNNINPLLDSIDGLGNNGGPTQTIALLCSSPAINNGISAGAPPTDQRGVVWIGAPDAGSYAFNDSLKLTQSVSICANDSVVIGGTIVHKTAGTFIDTISSAGGCDSIVTTTVSVRAVATYSQSLQICFGGSITVGGGIVHDTSGTFIDTLTAVNGCDSIVTTALTVYQIDTAVTVNGITLTATAGTGKTYQWISCGNNNQPVAGATSQTFIPAQTGTYAVAETQNSCTDTSSCYYVIVSGIEAINGGMGVNIYPNPTSNVLIVEFGKVIASGYVRVLDMLGHVLLEQPEGANSKMEINMTPYTSGVYFIEVSDNNLTTRSRIVKN